MAHISEPFVRELSDTEGTGNIVLDGPMFGSLAFSDVMSAGDTCDYTVRYGAVAEEGLATLNGSGELERTYVSRAKHANGTVDKNRVSLPPGTKQVILSVAGHRFIEIVNAAGGTANDLTLTTGRSLPALINGQRVTFVASATNTDAATINVDGLGVKPLRTVPGEPLVPGVVVNGTPYSIVYRSSGDQWLIEGALGDPYGVPLGGMMPYTGSGVPNSRFILPHGQAISRTTYAAYFNLIQVTYGGGDGSTTFNVPDLRGRMIAGLDNMGGSAAGRITTAVAGFNGSAVGAAGGAQSVTIAQANLPNYTLPNTLGWVGSVSGANSSRYATTGGPGSAGQPLSADNGVNGFDITPSWSGSVSGSITGSITSGGSGVAVNKMPPTFVLPFILRVL